MSTVHNTVLDQSLAHDPITVAQKLLGAWLEVDGCGGIVVETEAYTHDDPASHSFHGQTRRNRSMFGPPGIAYVYRSYGIHWCLNVVCGTNRPGAVLIRALEPLRGVDKMRSRRGTDDTVRLCSGPGRLTAALGIDDTFDGLPVDRSPFRLTFSTERPQSISVGCRIGIRQAIGIPWRFGISGSAFLSRPFP